MCEVNSNLKEVKLTFAEIKLTASRNPELAAILRTKFPEVFASDNWPLWRKEFHNLWSNNVGLPGYDKEKWIVCEQLIRNSIALGNK